MVYEGIRVPMHKKKGPMINLWAAALGFRGLGFRALGFRVYKGTLRGTLNRKPLEYSRNIMGIYLLQSLYAFGWMPRGLLLEKNYNGILGL